MLEFLKVRFLVVHFSYLINDIRDNDIHNFNICADDSSFYSKFEQVFDFWLKLELAFKLGSNPQDTQDFSGQEKINVFCLTSLITLLPLM